MTNYAARPVSAVRCAPQTEKTVLARLKGRPNDEDMLHVVQSGMDKSFRDRWACVSRGVVMTSRDSVVVRNQIESENPAKPEGSKTFRVFAHPRPDLISEAKTACLEDFVYKKKAYFFDALSIGVAKFARVKLDFVTDNEYFASTLQQILPKTPKSSIPVYFQPQSTLLLFHSSTKDQQVSAFDGYFAYDSKTMIGRGIPTNATVIFDAFAGLAAQRLADQEVLVIKGDVRKDVKSGQTTLFLPLTPSESKQSDFQVHASGYTAWGLPGLTRLFDAVPTPNEFAVKPLEGTLQSSVPHPKRIVFEMNKAGKSSKVDVQAAKKFFQEKFVLSPTDKAAALFEKLVQASGAELVLIE